MFMFFNMAETSKKESEAAKVGQNWAATKILDADPVWKLIQKRLSHSRHIESRVHRLLNIHFKLQMYISVISVRQQASISL